MLPIEDALEEKSVLSFLNRYGIGQLQKSFGIKVTGNFDYPYLYVLNYDQIKSAKYKDHSVVMECRSLVVESPWQSNSWRIVSRSFDRFFNEGEIEHEYDIFQLTAYEKIDGSLVSFFYHNGEWLYRTKSMLMPGYSDCMPSGRSWKELIESTIQADLLVKSATYIFEIVSSDNRVVTRYPGDQAYLLAMRVNDSGEYISNVLLERALSSMPRIKAPKMFKFDTMEHVLESVKSLPNLEEGYVMYDMLNQPVLKIKSPAYVAAHRLRGDSVLTPKRILEMIFIGESDEYLAIFPEDELPFREMALKINSLLRHLGAGWAEFRDIEDQKEYALAVMDKFEPFQSLFFMKRLYPEKSFESLWKRLHIKKALKILESYDI